MKKKDLIFLTILSVLCLYIWIRDLFWLSDIDNNLPVISGLFFFLWLGKPWKINHSRVLRLEKFILPLLIFILGIALSNMFLLSISWTLLFLLWLKLRLEKNDFEKIKKLSILLLLSFPWIIHQAGLIGWWFRLSGAWVNNVLFDAGGFNVVREGTLITINDTLIDVSPACSGLNTLQAMCITGVVLAYLILGKSNRFWYVLPVLILIAWLANTIRIFFVIFVALSFGLEIASGILHQIGGLLVLLIMFILTYIIFVFLKPDGSVVK